MRVLIIAFNFPPESGSGSFRPLFFANHLIEMGVDVHVLTAKVEDYLGRSIDWKLCERCHDRVGITRCSVHRPQEWLLKLRARLFSARSAKGGGAGNAAAPMPSSSATRPGPWQSFKDHVTDLLATPDPQVGWLPDCLKQGRRIIAQKRPDLIFATGGPWSSLVAGMLLKKATGVPLVLDFRDPWTSNPGFSRRARLFRGISRRLEAMVVRRCDGIVANTDPLREDFLKKYPFLKRERIVTLTNGFEEYLPQAARPAGQPFTIAHTGELYLSRNPVPLLQAVKTVVESGVAKADELRLQLVGGIDDSSGNVGALLQSDTLKKVVTVLPRVAYHEAQRYAMEADLLLLIQPDFPLQVPRKLYEYMALRKPVFCVAEAGSATGMLVSDHGLGTVSGNNLEELVATLSELLCAWRAERSPLFRGASCDRFTNLEITRELYRFFVSVTGAPADTSS